MNRFKEVLMTQSRFRLLLSLALVSAAVIIGMCPTNSVSADPINLTYANFPPATTFPCIQMERWVKEVEQRTNGKVKVKTFPGGTLLEAKNMFDGVVAGGADIGCLATAYQPGRFKELEVMDLPIGFSNATVASAVMWDLYEKHNPQSLKDVKVLTLFTCAPAQILASKPIRNLEDLQGAKLRAAGTGVEWMKLLGAAPVGMPQSDVPEALQKGVVQGNVTSMDVLKDMKYAEYCPYVTLSDLWVVPFAVVMNKRKWESLPEDVKKVFDDLRKDQAIWTGKYVDGHAKDAMEWSKKEHNVEFIPLSDEERGKWMGKVAPLVEDYVKKMEAAKLPGAQIVDDAKKLTEKYNKEFK
jgi:TRAP-type C4-dicarboxylate transport system substrate-binding protein